MAATTNITTRTTSETSRFTANSFNPSTSRSPQSENVGGSESPLDAPRRMRT